MKERKEEGRKSGEEEGRGPELMAFTPDFFHQVLISLIDVLVFFHCLLLQKVL